MDEEEKREIDLDAFNRGARMLTRIEVSDAVSTAVNDFGSAAAEEALASQAGMNAQQLNDLAWGRDSGNIRVSDLARIALALGKTLKIDIE